MMYGCGDDPAPLPESVDVVEDALVDFIAAVGRRAAAGAASSATTPAARAAAGRLQPEDVLFLVRRDAKLFGRCTELLALADEIAAAKKAFDTVPDG
jgi:uncharacterized ParB-like nuclease family protein